MHPINRLLGAVGLRVSRIGRDEPPRPWRSAEHEALYAACVEACRNDGRGFGVFPEEWEDSGDHPENFIDVQCAFAARHLSRVNPAELMDVGSYRHFVLGLLAHYRVTSVDVRARAMSPPNERVVIGDAKALPLPGCSVDAVTSLCAVEHFGLGRYGDAFDLSADRAAVAEMKRVLRPGGRLILTTTITQGAAAIGFNAHRIYTYDQIQNLCCGLQLEDESFFTQPGQLIKRCDVTKEARVWDGYCGCWRKPCDEA